MKSTGIKPEEVAGVILIDHDEMRLQTLTMLVQQTNLTTLSNRKRDTPAPPILGSGLRTCGFFHSDGNGTYSLKYTGDKEQFVRKWIGVEKYNDIVAGLKNPGPEREFKEFVAWEVAVVFLAMSSVPCDDKRLGDLITQTGLTDFGVGETPARTINVEMNYKKDIFKCGSIRNWYSLNCPTGKEKEFAIRLLSPEKYQKIKERLDETIAEENRR